MSGTGIEPAPALLIERRPRRKIVRQHAPLAATSHYIAQGVEHLAHIMSPLAATPIGLNQRPFFIADAAWVGFASVHAETRQRPIFLDSVLFHRFITSSHRGTEKGVALVFKGCPLRVNRAALKRMSKLYWIIKLIADLRAAVTLALLAVGHVACHMPRSTLQSAGSWSMLK